MHSFLLQILQITCNRNDQTCKREKNLQTAESISYRSIAEGK